MFHLNEVYVDSLGIDIGTVSVKYVRWRGNKGKGSVVSHGVYQYKGELEDLKGILTDIRIKEGVDHRVYIGLTSQDILKKTFTIPVLPKEELKEALNWSASKIVSSPLEEMIYECTVLGDVKERDIRKQEVFFAGARKEFVGSILSVFDEAGFSKVALLTDIAFTYLPVVDKSPESSVGVIDIGGRQTSIYVFSGKRLMFARETMTASESFSDALISGFVFSYEEAEEYKTHKGLTEESAGFLGLPLDRLSGEIRRTFNVYAQRYPEKPVKKFFITGRGSKMPNLLPKLREHFIEEIQYLTAMPGIEDEFLPAYSLCAYGDSFINLLPPEIRLKEKEAAYGKWARIGSVGVFGVLFFLSMEHWNELNKLGNALTIEMNSLSQKRNELNALGGKVSSSYHKEVLAMADEVRKKDVMFVTLMKYLSSRLPREVYLKEVDFDGYRKIEGVTKDNQKDALQKGSLAAIAAAGKQKAEFKETDSESKDYKVIIKGYIFGDSEVTGPSLLELIVRLQYSGFLREIEVESQEMKEIHGKKAMEFSIRARGIPHEV
ncbi:MAG: hypothetical protein C0392_00180 [Syntrophus sp. (in: bacteria)]|nr:hypothetical protein [Syntrophus sp. (in: bacteria)]